MAFVPSGGTLSVAHTTVTGNLADSDGNNAGSGGGVAWKGTGALPVTHSIIANNTDRASSPSFAPDVLGAFNGLYTLVRNTEGSTPSGSFLLSNVNPQLGPLADNGGRTLTHLLLPGSPAIDAGDPSFAPPPGSDQRGAPFVRVANGRIDIGALEVQPTPVSADFDSDGDRDGADFLRWQRGLGATGPAATQANGDADNDDDVDAADLAVWQTQFGSAASALNRTSQFSAAVATTIDANRTARDAIFAAGDFTSLFTERRGFRPLAKTAGWSWHGASLWFGE
jgi:hypothetical protein